MGIETLVVFDGRRIYCGAARAISLINCRVPLQKALVRIFDGVWAEVRSGQRWYNKSVNGRGKRIISLHAECKRRGSIQRRKKCPIGISALKNPPSENLECVYEKFMGIININAQLMGNFMQKVIRTSQVLLLPIDKDLLAVKTLPYITFTASVKYFQISIKIAGSFHETKWKITRLFLIQMWCLSAPADAENETVFLF